MYDYIKQHENNNTNQSKIKRERERERERVFNWVCHSMAKRPDWVMKSWTALNINEFILFDMFGCCCIWKTYCHLGHKMEDVPQMAVQDLKTTCSKQQQQQQQQNHQHSTHCNNRISHTACHLPHKRHTVKWCPPSQTMISIPSLMWRPRGTLKRLAREMHTRKYSALYKG